MHTKGFTLIEILIGVTITALVFIIAGSLFTSLYSSDARTKTTQNFEQTKNDLQIELSNGVRWANTITFGNNSLTVDNNTYNLMAGRIYKNGSPITTTEVMIQNFEIANRSVSPPLVSLEINIDMTDRRTTTSNDHMRLIISQRNKNLTRQ